MKRFHSHKAGCAWDPGRDILNRIWNQVHEIMGKSPYAEKPKVVVLGWRDKDLLYKRLWNNPDGPYSFYNPHDPNGHTLWGMRIERDHRVKWKVEVR